MLKKLSKIILSLTMIFGLVFSQSSIVKADGQTDINIIKGRLKEYFLELDTIDDGSKVETCYVSKASDYLALIQADGSFADVDYNAHNNAANGSAWSPYLAVDRIQAIAIAYHKPGNALYQSEAAKDGVDKALKYWVTQGSRKDKPGGPYSSNWWENEVGVQLRFARIGLFMEGVISEEGLTVITDKLLEKTPVKKGTGQNNLWFDQNHVYYALIKNDTAKLKDMITNYLNYCLVTQKDDNVGEAVQVDNSFYMHGRQFYSNGYGMSMFRDMSFWIYMLRGTEFAISQEVVDRMADYMLEGTRWTIRGDIQELYLGYRPYKYSVDYKNYAEEYIEPLKRMKAVDSEHASDYQKVLDNILGNTKDNGRDGNYYMWRSGYASHMRKNYGVNIKMDSRDLKGGEWRGSWPNGNNKGQLIYWTSAAASTISVDGDEYTNVYPVFDWKHTPGVTAPNALSGRYTFENGELFNIGVSNGNYGATAYKFDKMSTQGQKGYFFFDDEFVALGSNIKSTNGTAIHTTLNQSKASDLKVNGQTVGSTTGTKYNAKTIYNDDIGYVFLDNTDVNVSNTTQKDVPSLWPEDMKQAAPSVFSAWIDHGVKPTDASYSYVVVPGKTSAQVEQYSKDIPITVVANNKNVQAVRHDGLKQTQINFYAAGELEYKPGYKVSVNEPCSLIIDESGATRVITVAMRDQDSGKEVDIKLSYNGITTQTQLVTKGTPYAGQSLTVKEGESFKFNASSFTDGHAPTNTMDGNKDSYWESETNQNEWLSTYVDSNALVKNVKITWGDHYATQYDIYASSDGVNYTKIKSVTNGNGGEDIIALNGIYQYIKVDMVQSNSSNYQIKEIEFEKCQNLSRNKPVTASSENLTDDKKVGPTKHINDGDYSTRWKSKINTENEWVMIDLGKYSKIDKVSIKWETACSTNYKIMVSQDGKRWKDIKTNLATDTSLNDSFEFDNAYGRFVKVHSVTPKTPKWGISIFEVDVYGEEAVEPPIEISYLQNAFASSSDSTNVSNKVTDGNNNTYWQSATNTNEWIYLELKDIYQIKDVTVKWGDNFAKSYYIEVSEDAKNWASVKGVDSVGNGGESNFTDFDNAKARYVRLRLKNTNSDNFQVKEIIVHGDLIEKDEEVNLALKKTTKVSSEKDTSSKAALAVDGNIQSKWASQDNSNDEWIQMDLGDLYDVDRVKLYWADQGASKYKILGSRDGKDFTELYVEDSGQPGISDIQLDKSVPIRFIKMQGIESVNKGSYSLSEFEVYGKDYNGEDGTVNVAAYQPTAASTIDNQSIPANAVDTSKASTFKSLTEKNPWLNVFLKDVYSISAAKINFVSNNVNKYVLESSMDGEDWKAIKEITVEANASPLFVTFDEVDTRYVRIRVLDDVDRVLTVKDFAVYGKLSEKIEDINIAAFKTSSASTEFDNGQFLYESKYAFDESIESRGDAYQSRWVSDKTKTNPNADPNQWIQVNLGDYYDVSKVVLNWEGAYAKEYKIQVSIDGENWRDVSDVKNGMAGVKQFNYKDGQQAKYVRMNASAFANQNGYSLWEFEVYGLSIRTQLKSLYDQNANIDLSAYTPRSAKAFKDALNKGIQVYQNDEVSLKDITDAITLIETAKDGLTKKADKANLISLMSQANQLKESHYTEASYKAVIKAKQQAQVVVDNQNASNADVVSAYNLLKQAIDSLVKKPNIDINIEPEDDIKDKVVIKDSKNDITIAGKLPKDVQLKTKAYTKAQVETLIEKIKKQNPQFLTSATLEKVFDIDLLLKDQKYNFDGTIQVIMKVDKELRDKNIGIVYIDEAGNVVKIKSTTDKEYITFNVSHLSTYAIVSYNDANDEGVAESGKVDVPKTNDNQYIGLYVVLGTVSLGYLIFRKRKSYVRNKK